MGSLVAELAEKLSSATNNFDIDDGTIYVNTSADTVGIGTTTPGSKLDVQGTVTADGLTVGSDNTILKEVNSLSLTISGSTTDSTGGNITLYGDASGGTSRIRFRNDATEAMRIEGNGDISFYEDTGTTPKFFWDASAESLGIGTSSPAYALDIQSGDIRIEDSDANKPALFFTNTDSTRGCSVSGSLNTLTLDAGDTDVATGGTSTLLFKIDSTERMRIDSSGNIGLGVTSPLSPLHQIDPGSSSAGEIRVGGDGVAFGIKLVYDQSSSTTGTIYSSPTYTNSNAVLKLGCGNGNTDQLVLKGDGNVGIGTSSPRAKAEVYDSSVSGTYDATDLSTWRVLQIRNNIEGGAGTAAGIALGGDGTNDTETAGIVGISDNTTGGVCQLAFLTAVSNGSIERMRIESSGNVGIGESVPLSRLHIKNTSANDGIRIVSSTTDEGYFIFGDTADTNIGSIAYNHTADAMRFTVNNAERMRIDSSGKVGIGTTDPATKLEVSDNQVGTPIVTIENTTANESTVRFKSAHSASSDYRVGASISISNAFEIYSVNSAVSNLLINSSGNVGIGTTSPDTRLEVNAGAAACITTDRSNSGAHIQFDSNGSEKGSISESGGTVSYNPFTGSHYGWIDGSCELGKVLIMTGVNQHAYNDATQEIIYGIEECSVENDSRFLGSYLSVMNPDNDRTIGDSDNSANPDLVMAVGNGKMWVVDEGSNITQGDNLITSTTQGHACKDPQTAIYSYVIARAGEPVNWTEVSETVEGKKHKLISILFDIYTVKN